MSASFFFYDLETSGFSPRTSRIMQFAGQRTDMELNLIGEPLNQLIKLTPDILPEPDAILLTGITPQKTISEGLSEADFLKLFYEKAVTPDTIFVGFNSIRFDDEFMRFINYRNFYEPYEWQWKDGRSRWDILDPIRMTRALRPEGIKWPFASDGKPANRLEYLTKINKISHKGAHDALSDVKATIAIAKLLKTKQPDLFSYLLKMRNKKVVAELVEANKPFVYTSSHYSSEFLHTTIVDNLVIHPDNNAALVYDLRFDPSPFMAMSVDELISAWQFTRDPEAVRLPIKTLKYNRAPAIAPIGVIKDKATEDRLKLDMKLIDKHLKILKSHKKEFAKTMLEVIQRLDSQRQKAQTSLVDNQLNVDERLYENFINKADASLTRAVRAAQPDKLNEFKDGLKDERLKNLLPLYKARNYPKSLDALELKNWEDFCKLKLIDGAESSRAAIFFNRLKELSEASNNQQKAYLLEELQLYGQSIMPAY